MTIVAPSILSADFGRLAEEVKAVVDAGADWVHVDVMDGRFVPNITIGPLVVSAVKKASTVPLDVHLMIVEPEKYLADFAKAGADYLTIHAEATVHLHRQIEAIKALGVKAGVSINPGTPLCSIAEVLHMVDLVLVMTVNPGFGGQKFIESTLDKIQKLSEFRKERGLGFLIEIDGGMNDVTSKLVIGAGADALVAGNFVFSSKDYGEAIRKLR